MALMTFSLCLVLLTTSWIFLCATASNKDKWLGTTDPNSFSNPEDYRTESIDIKWSVDFDKHVVSGSVTLALQVLIPSAKELILDTRNITVTKVRCIGDDKDLPFKIGTTVATFGEPLTIQVADVVRNSKAGDKLQIQIEYSTSTKSSALQWLSPIQTLGKQQPYMFSLCQAIHCRSLLPCQDTPYVKATFTAEVSVPSPLRALMGAVAVGEPETKGASTLYRFEQTIPIPSYLIAIAVGALVGREIGPRSTVWTEVELLDKAANEFSETENMLKAAENIFGRYVWGQYDMLVLPPSFNLGGMENPCLTFISPALIAGDKSLVNLVAHEISHSWTGNIVTNQDWEHYWLNEGFTVLAERKILRALYGEKFEEFAFIYGWKDLHENLKELGMDNPYTKLVVDLNGVDPDDTWSSVPYEKGAAFMYYLQQKVGGADVFIPFLNHYIKSFSFKSINSTLFQNTFITYFGDKGLTKEIGDIDWDGWFFKTGMPLVENKYDQTLMNACTDLRNRWLEWDPSTPNPFHKADLEEMHSLQISLFFQTLLEEKEPLSLAKVKAMAEVYDMMNRRNFEIRYRWIRIGLKSKFKDILPLAYEFVNKEGRMKYIRPVYRDLYAWEEIRTEVLDNFKENSKYMMHILSKMLLRDLNLE